MRHPIKIVALAVALTASPACAALRLPALPNPIAAAQTLDQQAYATLHAYAVITEEAADIVADPATPIAFKRLLGQAERVATPAIETLHIALTAYLQARAAFDTTPPVSQGAIERAAVAFAVATRQLSLALEAARGPLAELSGLVRAQRES